MEPLAGRGVNRERIEAALARATSRLLEMRSPEGCWKGRLSSSALSTATAVSALSLAARPVDEPRIRGGIAWLARTQNSDGGWGDTTDSPSNLSTSLLVQAALTLGRAEAVSGETQARLEAYLRREAGSTQEERREAVCAAYAPDRTFAVPILANLALAGLTPWEGIPALPFELAALPPSWFRFLRLHVVSYALPALIAVGLAIDRNRPPPCPVRRWIRRAAAARALRKLGEIQPSSGGFLEAVPLTSFVAMSLVPLFGPGHPVARKGIEFLRTSAREDGSWPIDTDLSVWITTAATAALAETAGPFSGARRGAGIPACGADPERMTADTNVCPTVLGCDAELSADLAATREWILSAQHLRRHPYTDSPPGGWAWTDLPGGVPDADDTAGAILALARLGERGASIEAGARWLLDLQNSDGGWPTFCRGWGHLPFDRSAPDLTAHVLRALAAFDPESRWPGCRRARERGLRYLRRQVRADGSWHPLWFGSQGTRDHANPVIGTARVLRTLALLDPGGECTGRARRFLLESQNPDGGWGGSAGLPSTVEETALALSALSDARDTAARNAVERGAAHLAGCVESGAWIEPSPIGLYFARLWYSEEAYPAIWTVEALGRILTGCGTPPSLTAGRENPG